MHGVHGEAGDVAGDDLLPVDLVRPHVNRCRVHDAAVDDDRRKRSEDAERHAAATQQALAEQHAHQEAHDAGSEHLPGRTGSGGEHHVGHQHGDGAHEKARLTAEGHAGDDAQCQHRLEARQHEEDHAPGHADGAEHRDDDQLPRLRLSRSGRRASYTPASPAG